MDWLMKAGGTAYPVSGYLTPEGGAYTCAGMTLRDWFAGQFISGIAQTVSHSSILYTDAMAKDAYAIADAMLKERAK